MWASQQTFTQPIETSLQRRKQLSTAAGSYSGSLRIHTETSVKTLAFWSFWRSTNFLLTVLSLCSFHPPVITNCLRVQDIFYTDHIKGRLFLAQMESRAHKEFEYPRTLQIILNTPIAVYLIKAKLNQNFGSSSQQRLMILCISQLLSCYQIITFSIASDALCLYVNYVL